MSPPLRVVQWATGVVGRHALRAVVAHPGLELVGARGCAAEKAGRDVGELCDLGPIGVCAAAPGIRTFLDLPIIAGRGALGFPKRNA